MSQPRPVSVTTFYGGGKGPRVVVYEDTRTFSKKLEKLRKSKKMTIKQFAEQMRWAEHNVADWEKGNVPDLRTLERIAAYFQVSKEYLLSAKDDIENEQLTLF